MGSSQAPLSVLITDDIKENRNWIAGIIRSILPHAVIEEAEDGAKAIQAVADKIKHQGHSFDLIIMDYKMPVLNGEKATAGIREIEKNIQNVRPSIIITWSTSKISAYPLADDWLPKFTTKQEVERKLIDLGLITEN